MSEESPRIHAPEFGHGLEWFNVVKPLTLKSLRGKVVLLDFWTYGCVNCMHIMPDLKRLEEKYGDALVVVGVHSAKFTNEKKPDNIRRILIRYEIDHPVVNDAEFRVWREYGARAWPTQVLIDPEGYVVATASGEGHAAALDEAVMAVIAFFDEQGKIDRTPLVITPERENMAASTLRFPGKVLADEANGRLFIADSSHNRILVTTLEGAITEVIGDGVADCINGPIAAARFFRPQGLAIDGEKLYVADTGNHLIRVVDLAARRVSTLAGTGKQAGWGGQGGAAREVAISSPWDLALVPDARLLFVAMAGTHQVWVIDLERQLAFPYAGSGREARVDGTVDEAAFAQPSGLALGGRESNTLFVADAESNIIRVIDLPPTNTVRTLAGGDLFEFGDRDGRGDAARLQHPLGVVWHEGRLFVADTYNHKIRLLDPVSGALTAFAGSGEEGLADGAARKARLHEPGGLSAGREHLFVADTNNHAIRKVSLKDGRVETLRIA